MRKLIAALALATAPAALIAPAFAQDAVVEAAAVPADVQAVVDQLIAAKSDEAYRLVEDLTTEIGPRLAGSDAEARARDWAVEELKAMGFQNVRIEPFSIPYWCRTLERAEVVGPNPQRFVLAALGDSGPTQAGGVEAEIVRFTSIRALEAADAGAVRGRIVFIDEPMVRETSGAGYGPAVAKRSECALKAQAKGAVACVIRSVGTHSHRFAHQGGAVRPGPGTLPAAAISPPDADQLARLLERGSVRLNLEIRVEKKQDVQSGNVIGEIVGRERPGEIVLIGGHLDSWDQGTGALDDGAGVAITAAAAKLIKDLPVRPRRTIRVIFWGSEETGLHGARAYAQAHKDELPRHIVAAESDFGAGRIWRLDTRFGPGAEPYAKALQYALAPLRIIPGDNAAQGGPDVTPLRQAAVPVVQLQQDGLDYFNYHHTADDTLDKIDPAALQQNVAAYAAFAYLAAEMGWDFRGAPQ